jgi:hypothetical protein
MKKTSWLVLLTLLCSVAQANYDAKPLSPTKGGTGSSSQSANVVVTTDGSGNIVSTSSTTSTELGYLHGVTSSIQSQFSGLSSVYVPLSQKGAVSGVASLDGSGKVPVAQLPSTVMEYLGVWNASTNTPALSNTGSSPTGAACATGTNGNVYRVSVAGSTNFGAGSIAFNVGDFVICNSALTLWQNSPAADGVTSVNGMQGAVTVNAINQLTSDVTAGPASGSASAAATVAAIQGTTVSGTTGTGNVVFSASPTVTGTLAGASETLSGTLVATGAISGSNLTAAGHASADLKASNNLSDVSSAATSFANISPLTTAGDIVYENNTPAPARLAAGTNGQVLTLVSGLPAWSSVAASANQALSNLSSVAINTSLLPATAGSANLGSAALPFGTDFEQALELMGSSSGNFKLQASATTTSWTATAPAAVCGANQYWADNGSGVYSCTSPAAVNATVVNGGDAAYSITSGNFHVRAGTTLTAQRAYTLPACTSGNIGERHEVKNPPAQTFNIVLTAAGTDSIDGASTYTLTPGDSVPVICSVYASAGTWDVE